MGWFLLRYLLVSVILYALIRLPFFQNTLNLESHYTVLAVSLTGWVAGVLGLSTTVSGHLLFCQGFGLKVVFGCSGLEALLIYFAGVVAWSAQWRFRLLWAVGGAAILITTNTLRLVLLLYVGMNDRELFDLIHTYVTQGIMIFLAIGLFWLYTQQSLSSESQASHS